MKKIITSHDPLVRKRLSDITIAREFLQIYLPGAIIAKCNLESLAIESGSFIENNLNAQYADIIYKLELLESLESVYIYTLFEHQSNPDKLMPLRILKYQLAIIDQHLSKYKNSQLPLVIPLVFYNGKKSSYPYPTDIKHLFMDKELYEKMQLGTFKIIDITTTDDEDILKHIFLTKDIAEISVVK